MSSQPTNSQPTTYRVDFAPLAAWLDDNPGTPRDGWQYMGHHSDGATATGAVDYRRRERLDRGEARMAVTLPSHLGLDRYDTHGCRIA